MDSEFGKVDHYNCLKFDCTRLSDSEPHNHEYIVRGLEHYGSRIKAAWVKLSSNQLHLLAMFVGMGFVLHHCNSDNSILLYKWLRSSPSTIPEYSNHFIGVGGVVLDDQDNILVIQIRNQARRVVPWKIPGGYVETQESLATAGVREVKEETGVDGEPLGIIGFREICNAPYGRRDIYFVMLMRPLSKTIDIQDTKEVEFCEWMPFTAWLEAGKATEACRILTKLTEGCISGFRDFLAQKVMPQIGEGWGVSRPINDPKYWANL